MPLANSRSSSRSSTGVFRFRWENLRCRCRRVLTWLACPFPMRMLRGAALARWGQLPLAPHGDQFLAESHSNQPYSQILLQQGASDSSDLLFVLFFFCTLLQPLIEVNTAMEAASSTTQAHSGTDADDDSGGCGMFFLQKSAVKNDGCQ